MRLSHIFSTALFSLILFSCQNNTPSAAQTGHTEAQKAEQEQKRSEIMAIHDAVMPQTAALNRLSRQIKEFMQTEQEAGKLDENRQESLLEVLKRLGEADEAMYDWMGKFYSNLDLLRDSMDHPQVMTYLDAKLIKIQNVDALTKSSMEKSANGDERIRNQSTD
ncbi:MAG: hypothetical protein IPJ40_08505 [Saprospirales bacterium]|nr:hypothetical protein [Saprospirales bacterium]